MFIEHRLSRAYSIIRLVEDHYKQLRLKEIGLRKEWMGLRSEQHQRDIANIQFVAEVFFFVALLPYYGSHILTAFLKPKSEHGAILLSFSLSIVVFLLLRSKAILAYCENKAVRIYWKSRRFFQD